MQPPALKPIHAACARLQRTIGQEVGKLALYLLAVPVAGNCIKGVCIPQRNGTCACINSCDSERLRTVSDCQMQKYPNSRLDKGVAPMLSRALLRGRASKSMDRFTSTAFAYIFMHEHGQNHQGDSEFQGDAVVRGAEAK